MVEKKGKPRHYEEWQPEYTPTGRLTKKSQRQLDAIRTQAIAEDTLDSIDFNDMVEGGSFIGLVLCFKYGINPAVLGLFQWGKDVVETIGQRWNEFVIWVDDPTGLDRYHEEKVRTKLTKEYFDPWYGMTVDALMREKVSHKKTLEGNIETYKKVIARDEAEIERMEKQLVWMAKQRDKFWEEGTITTGDIPGESAGDRMQLSMDRIYRQIANLRSIIDGGAITELGVDVETGEWGKYIRTVDVGRRQMIPRFEEQITIIAAQIDAKVLSIEDAKKLRDKLEWIDWLVCLGEAGSLRWLFKSYEMSELISNVKPFG